MKVDAIFPLREFQELLEQKLAVDVDYARSLVSHNGERGRTVELVFSKMLERHLPKGFGIKTGFAIDHKGNRSQQIDLLIVDQMRCPKFLDEGIAVLPAEAVIMAIEVKTKLDKREFDDARAKARSLDRLDRSAIIPVIGETANPFPDANGGHRPMFLVVALESIDTRKLLNSVSGEVIEPIFLSMDKRCLIRGSNPDGTSGWTYELDYPAAMFVLLASMLTSQARMPIIDVTKYLKVNPVR